MTDLSIPTDLLRMPGFVSDLMDYSLANAKYPNHAMAFVAAVAMQSFLCGRKIQDPSGCRPNVYLLCLANSGSGKDYPRKVNIAIARELDLVHCLVGEFASGPSVEDALAKNPCLLAQTDEMDAMMIKFASGETHHVSLEAILKEIYTTSGSTLLCRRLAKEPDKVVDFPHLTIIGTSVPTNYYDAMSERFISDGFFSRFVVFESAKRASLQSQRIIKVPRGIMRHALRWRDHPSGKVVTVNWEDGVDNLVNDLGNRIDEEFYNKAEAQSDTIEMTLWSRVIENALKFAMIRAASESLRPSVSKNGLIWAHNLMVSLTKTTIKNTKNRVSIGLFDRSCLRLLSLIRASDGPITHSDLLKRSKMEAKSLIRVVETLEERCDLVVLREKTPGRDRVSYILFSTQDQ